MELYSRSAGDGPPVILLHGLFGSNENLGGLARALADDHRVIGMDLRNHGRSPHAEAMDYPSLAGDVAETMDTLGLDRAAVVGHSLGGKTAMELALGRPDRVDRLAVIDIAPVDYARRHDEELEALLSLDPAALASRRTADEALAQAIPREAIRQFLLKNLRRGESGFEWRIPLRTIESEYPRIAAAPSSAGPYDGSALFLRGGASDYVGDDALPAIRERFPAARIETVSGAAHWVHVDSPDRVVDLLRPFLAD